MSVQIIAAVLDCRDPELTSARRMVLVSLANRAGQDANAWPSQELIAGECGMGLRTLKEHLAWLEREGFITRSTQNLGRGKGSRTLYRLHVLRLVTGAKSAPEKEPVASADNARAEIARANNAGASFDTYGCGIPHLTNRQEPISKASALESPRSKKSSQAGKGKVRGAARRTSIAENWSPGPTGLAYAASKGLSNQEIQHECEKFAAHYGKHRGSKQGMFTDWHKVWTGWVLRSLEFRAERAARSGDGRGQQAPQRDARPTSFASAAAWMRDQGQGDMELRDAGRGGAMDGGFVIDGELAGDCRGDDGHYAATGTGGRHV